MKRNIGIYNLHMRTMGGGEKLTLALAEHLSLGHNVWLFHPDALDAASLEQFFGVDLSRVRLVSLPGPGPLLRVLAKVRGGRQPAFSLHHYLHLKRLKLDLFINNSYASGLTCPASRGLYVCMFPSEFISRARAGSRLQRVREAFVDGVERWVTGRGAQDVVDSYSSIVAISRYTAEWVRHVWARDPELLYPPCTDMGPAADKAKILLHVGRFVAASGEQQRHQKGQDLLLETFKELTDLHRDGWQLHLAGSVGADDESTRFVAALARSAQGFPVTFHLNAALEEVRALYRRAAIYWHATGYGFPADAYPAKQEHFGITTVEAMSAGAVPVVYDSGGQREIVTHGHDGFRWDDRAALVEQTLLLIREPELRARLSSEAVLSSKRFGRAAFAASVDALVGRFLSEPQTSFRGGSD